MPFSPMDVYPLFYPLQLQIPLFKPPMNASMRCAEAAFMVSVTCPY